MRIPKPSSILGLSLALAIAAPAQALNIVITNDDGFEASFIHALYQRLKAAGHSVIISAPTADSSGQGGALNFLRPVTTMTKDSRAGAVKAGAPGIGTLASDADVHYVDSTPVASALYGIDVAAQRKWGKAPDLLVSGINYGNNTGIINNGSGTVNAALIAINRGVPAIAASAEAPTSYRSHDKLVAGDVEYENADIVVRLVNELDKQKSVAGGKLLPDGIGLNVNMPKFAKGAAANLPIKFSKEGIASSAMPFFVPDLSKDAMANSYIPGGAPPLPGVTLYIGGTPPANVIMLTDTDPTSEQNVVKSGAVAVSVISVNHQADRAPEAAIRLKLNNLAK
ncbi:5'/3'-nucleotidase SurE [Noviherbaspirillum saxi]|uniref:5'-nucleotidase n=1 Tax=Noviherbaspirillum saxi TaxID=2320863 RepID=A0A3A3FJJ5_9BURK|nr:5'/3'-nucleotidase SurE [Noviherbaspirillum saxi]RJF92558.1 acid phosphatase [Noviherbaspirillum saxi]